MAGFNLGDIVAHLKLEMGEFSNNMKNATNLVNDVGKSAAKTANGGFSVMKGVMSHLATNVVTGLASNVKELGKSVIEAGAQVQASNAQFAQTFKGVEEQATQTLKNIAKETGVNATRMQDSFTKIYGFAKASGAETEQAMNISNKALRLAADGAAYYDESLETTAERLQSFIKGNYENDAALGVSCTEFTRNAKAVEMFGTEFKKLDEIQKQEVLLQMVEDAQKASGAFGQASREAGSWENVMGNLKDTWNQFLAKIGTPILQALIPVIQDLTAKFSAWAEGVDWDAFSEKVAELGKALMDAFKWVVDNKALIVGAIVAIVAALATFNTVMFISNLPTMIVGVVSAFTSAAATIGLAWTGLQLAFLSVQEFIVGSLIPALSSLWAFMLANPITFVIAAIAALAVAFIVLWNKCEGFREFWINLWNTCKEALLGFYNENKAIFDNIVNTFKNCWEAIKLIFGGFLTFLKGVFTGDMQMCADGLNQIWEGVKQWFVSIWDGIKNHFSMIWANMKSEVSNATSNMKSAIQQFGTNAFNAIKNACTNMINSLKTWVSNMKTKAREGADKFISTITSTLSSLPSKMVSIGTSICEGIASGIKKGIDKIKSAVSWLADKVEGFSRGEFGINSPSKLMRDTVGIGIMEGIAAGIDGNLGLVKDAISQIKDVALDGVNLPSINTGLANSNLVGSLGMSAVNANSMAGMYINPYHQYDGNSNKGVDYDRMAATIGAYVYDAMNNSKTEIYMDKIKVGMQVAETVEARNAVEARRMARINGEIYPGK